MILQRYGNTFFGKNFRTLLPMLSALGFFCLLTEATQSVMAGENLELAIKATTWIEIRKWYWSSSGGEGFMEHCAGSKSAKTSALLVETSRKSPQCFISRLYGEETYKQFNRVAVKENAPRS